MQAWRDIRRSSELLKNIDKKGALGQALALEAEKYSIVDIQRISAGLAREINRSAVSL